jgi:hypothetical protein
LNLYATADFLTQNGESIALRRLTGRGVFIEVICKARVTDYAPDEMVGGIVQGDRKMIISNREIEEAKWPGPPRAGDQVILLEQNGDTAMVRASYPNRVSGQTVRHTLQIRGA